MRFILLIAIVACSLCIGRLLAQPKPALPVGEMSPHAEALRLVFAKCGDRIRAVDQENWWHDVKSREWKVRRPFYPGVIDSTHMFDVGYQIDGKIVASWLVDTRAGTAQEATLPSTQPGR
jgi:hypothetical protein